MSSKVQKIKQEIERRIDVCEKYSQLHLTESTRIGNHAQLLELREIKDFIDSLPEESTDEANCTTKNEDLEDAAYHFCMDEFGNPKESLFEFDQRCFIAGAEWQKQQMKEALQTEYEKGLFDMREEIMKDAVEGEYWDGSIYLDNRPTEYKDGDKVKIIICKTEQQ